MINLKSLQLGGKQPVADNYKQLAIDLQNKVQNQMYDLEEAVIEMLQTGEDPNSVGMALMTLGYEEQDVIKLFQALSQQQQAAQEEVAQEEETSEVEQMIQDTAPMQQQPTAKKGGSFKDWYKQLGGGTHNTYYAQFGTEKPRIGETQTEFSLRVYGNPGVYNNTKVWDGEKFVNSSQYKGAEQQIDESQFQIDYSDFVDIDQSKFPGFTLGDPDDFGKPYQETPITESELDIDYTQIPEEDTTPSSIKDISSITSTGVVSDTTQGMPSTISGINDLNTVDFRTASLEPEPEMKAPKPIKNKPNKQNNFFNTETPFSDAVNAISFVNRMFFPQFDPNRVYEQTMADNAFAAKNYQPALGHKDVHRGIQQSGLRVPFINFGQNGTEMNKFEDYYMMRMGGMNPMYNYFMDNELPMYQYRGETDSTFVMPSKKTLEFLRNKYGTNKDGSTIRMNRIKDFDKQSRIAQINRALLSQQGMDATDEIFNMQQSFDQPAKRIEYIYTKDQPSMFREPQNYGMTPEERMQIQKAYEQDYLRQKQRQSVPGVTSGPGLSPEMMQMLKNDTYRDELSPKMYGGSSNPFSKKRKLRKKVGGQIADIPTEILKKLMAKGAKFDIL